MNKKILIAIVAVIIVAVLGIGAYILLGNKDNNKKVNTDDTNTGNKTTEENKNDDNQTTNDNQKSNSKTLVVYYSATGSTKEVAMQISKNLDADLFEIVPEDIYTSDDLDWTNDNSRVTKEHNDESLRDVKLKNMKVDNWENYDRVFIGYPIWWGIAAWPVDTFVKNNNFGSKTVIPFCTSASSSLGQSGKLLEDEANGGKWLEGMRFNSGASGSEIKTWTDSLK